MKKQTDQYSFRVKYSETDKMGYVHHSNYARYCENARWEFFRKKGVSYCEIEENGIMLPVVKLECRYVYPAFYDELLIIETSVVRIKGATIDLSYDIYNEKEQLINQVTTTLAFVDSKTRRPRRAPKIILEKFGI